MTILPFFWLGGIGLRNSFSIVYHWSLHGKLWDLLMQKELIIDYLRCSKGWAEVSETRSQPLSHVWRKWPAQWQSPASRWQQSTLEGFNPQPLKYFACRNSVAMLQWNSLNECRFALLVTQPQSFIGSRRWCVMQLPEQPSASKHLLTLFIKVGVELLPNLCYK